MEKDIIAEMGGETAQKKNKMLPVIGIVSAVLLVIIVAAFAVLNSPKVLMGILIGKTPETVREVFAAQSEEQPLFMSESHQSETKITMDGEGLGLDGDIEMNVLTAYQNDTGDLAAELELGMGDLDAVTAGLYLSNSEVALISSVLSNKYVVDLETQSELGKDTTLEERLMGLMKSQDDEQFQDLMTRLKDKVLELRKLGVKELPRAAMDKGKDSIEVFEDDQKVKYVEAVLDKDYFKDWAEIVLEQVADDSDLEDLIVEIAEYLNDTVVFEDEFDIDEIDLEEYCDDMLDELDDVDAEVSIRIYHKGFTPIAYEVAYEDDYSDGEAFIMLISEGQKLQMLLDADIDGDKMYYNVYQDSDNYNHIEYEFDDMQYDVTIEKVKAGLYEIDGDFDYGDMGKGTVEGQIEEAKDETTFEMTVSMTDDYDTETEIKYEGSIAVEDSVTTTELTADITSDGEDVAKIELECDTEEIRKNKEYATEGSLVITDLYMDTEYTIDFENSIIFGDEAEADLPSWSKSDVYAKISDEDAMNELFDTLSDDAEAGFNDLFSLIMYGGLY